MTPQLVDLNGDGYQDMIMATFEGTAFVVEGSRKGWKKPAHIVDENDTNVRIAMYYDNEKGDYATVDRSTDDYESDENHHMTSVALVDWDDDGDLDLILGAYSRLQITNSWWTANRLSLRAYQHRESSTGIRTACLTFLLEQTKAKFNS